MKKILFVIIIGVIISSIFIPLLAANASTCKEGNKNTDGKLDTDVSDGTCSRGVWVKNCCPTEGLLVCGEPCCRCRLCDFFILINKIIVFAIFTLVPVAAVILIIIGGTMFLISSGDPSKITKARNIILSVLLGLTIIYSSYMVIGFVLKSIGLASWVGGGDGQVGLLERFIDDGVFEINCGGVIGTGTPPATSGGGPGSGDGTGLPGLPASGIDAYCEGKSWSPTWNCLAAYGNKNSQWFKYCAENPCGVVGTNGKGCHVVDNGLTIEHCDFIR